MKINKKSQTILGYAVLIVVVVAAIIAMSVYMKRRVQGSYKRSADVFGQGEQYEPFGETDEQKSGEMEWISSEVIEPEAE